MKAPRQSTFALLWIAVANVPMIWGATLAVPDDRDRQVLESLLLHLLADGEFDLTRASTNGATIVLNTHTPEKTGFLMSYQTHSEIGSHRLPSDAENDMRRRNRPVDAKPDTYDAVKASYTNLPFAAGIVVTDLAELWKQRLSFGSFEEAHPKARGWLEAYLPGYSEDGTSAVVRAGVGPGHTQRCSLRCWRGEATSGS